MGAKNLDPQELERAVEYYKKRLDDLGGDNLQKDYQISGLRKELTQRRRGFTVLSQLQTQIGTYKQISEIFEATLRTITTTLGMDRAFVLTPAEKEHHYIVQHWSGTEGLPPDFSEKVTLAQFEFPPDFATSQSAHILVHKKTEKSPLMEQLSQQLHLPFLVGTSVVVEGRSTGILIAGRLKEAGVVFAPLDQNDVETLQSVTGLIAAVVQNMRVTALQEMDRLKTDFFANLSHEFRTPITLTLGPLKGILSGRYGEISEDLKSQAEIMTRNQQRLLGLINQILDLSKLESGKVDLAVKEINDFNKFVDIRMGQFRTNLAEKGIELKSNFDSKVKGAGIFIDGEKMDKVVFNLLSNSSKFTKQGCIEVQTEIRETNLFVRVKDTGIGIRADQIGHIFDRFRQADGSSSREHAGTGIGLAMVKEIVKLHGGDIVARSEYGKGTTFEFYFPVGKSHHDANKVLEGLLDQDEDANAQVSQVVEVREGATDTKGHEQVAKLNSEVESTFQKKLPTILYVDDNPDLRTYVRGLLKSTYNVYIAVDGNDGWEKLHKYSPDLILSDWMMPSMTGPELCIKVRKDNRFKSLPFVLLTARSGVEAKLEGLDGGADDFLNKPFSEVELLTRLSNLIKIREQHLRIKKELQSARGIQQALLPPLNQTFSGAAIEALYKPCEELSGDFFGIHDQEKWLYFYLADVTSHGTAAAQVTYLVKGIFTEILNQQKGIDLPTAMKLFSAKYASYKLNYAVGLQFIRFEKSTKKFEYVRSNAPVPVLVNGTKIDYLDHTPAALVDSANKETEIPVLQKVLAGGDKLYFFTDGCYEFNEGNRPLGYRRFCGFIKTHESPEWREKIFAQLVDSNKSESFSDDLTMLRFSVQD